MMSRKRPAVTLFEFQPNAPSANYHERWAAPVPPGFAFAVKAPQEIRHQLRWASADAALKAILAHAAGLGRH
jgi:uncharacterized protein YecE (DUF72 family)